MVWVGESPCSMVHTGEWGVQQEQEQVQGASCLVSLAPDPASPGLAVWPGTPGAAGCSCRLGGGGEESAGGREESSGC